MDRIKKAADSKIPPIPFTYTDPATVVATTIPLDPILIGRAKANLIPIVGNCLTELGCEMFYLSRLNMEN